MSFEPHRPGKVSLIVTRNGGHITGSPANINVTAPPSIKVLPLPGGVQFIAGRKSTVPLSIANVDLADLKVVVRDESGFEV